MIVTPTLVLNVKAEQWHKQEIQHVYRVLLVYTKMILVKEHANRAMLVHGVIQKEVHRHQTVSDADKEPTQRLEVRRMIQRVPLANREREVKN